MSKSSELLYTKRNQLPSYDEGNYRVPLKQLQIPHNLLNCLFAVELPKMIYIFPYNKFIVIIFRFHRVQDINVSFHTSKADMSLSCSQRLIINIFCVTVASQTHFKPQKMLYSQNIPHYISGAKL